MNKRRCPDCHDLIDSLWCEHCMFEYYDCGTCGKVFGDESDAADCEYEHRTVLDDIVDAID